jgi:adenylylsulfate kinase
MGLSGSGKSTLAKALENDLFKRGYTCFVLDGDNVRNGLNRDLGFSEQDRNENIRRIAEVAKLFVDAGIIVICSCITPFEHQRQIAKQIIGEIDYYLIYVNTPVEVCERRDVKGLYAKAKRSEMLNFTGVNSPFEEPQELNLVVNTDGKSVEDILREMLDAVLPLIQINSTVREK